MQKHLETLHGHVHACMMLSSSRSCTLHSLRRGFPLYGAQASFPVAREVTLTTLLVTGPWRPAYRSETPGAKQRTVMFGH